MAQTKEGAIKCAARKIGVAVEEYCQYLDRGEKWCFSCKNWRPVSCFNLERSRWDGRHPKCQSCTRVKVRKTTKGRPAAFKGRKHSPESKRKMAEKARGQKKRLGKTHTPESIAKIIATRRERNYTGGRSPAWRGGITDPNKAIRATFEYREWRKAVYERDGYICQDCGDDRGGNLNAHHIKSFADHPESRLDIKNGITLCETCHEKRHFKPDSTRNIARAKKGELNKWEK